MVKKRCRLKASGASQRQWTFKKKNVDYFKALVYFNNEKSLNKKSRFFEILQSTHQSNKSVLLRNDQFEYFKHWYCAVLREVSAY